MRDTTNGPSGRARWIGRALGEPVGLAGAFLGAALFATAPGGTGFPGLVVGWVYAKLVGLLIRGFRVPPPAYPLVGLLAGPLPFALLMQRGAGTDARGLVWVGFVAGALLGLVAWASARHSVPPGGTLPPTAEPP